MKRLVLILACITATLTIVGEEHMMFRNMPIDGELKLAMKKVKDMGFMGMRMKNMGALMGTLDNEEVMITLMATPKTNTLFSVIVIYDGAEDWNSQLNQYKNINSSIAKKYGEPTELINQWESPYSINNNPIQAFKEDKAQYGAVYTTEQGNVSVNMVYVENEMCIMVTYIDNKNLTLYIDEGGQDMDFDNEEMLNID